jgi:hypothetical protein
MYYIFCCINNLDSPVGYRVCQQIIGKYPDINATATKLEYGTFAKSYFWTIS